jgi:hypothetical protein
MKEKAFQMLKSNESFEKLPLPTQYALGGRVAKTMQAVFESRGQTYFDAYVSELKPRLERVNWLWVKDPAFIWKRWTGIKKEINELLKGNSNFYAMPSEVVKLNVELVEKCVKSLYEKIKINNPAGNWVKNPKGGWMKNANM